MSPKLIIQRNLVRFETIQEQSHYVQFVSRDKYALEERQRLSNSGEVFRVNVTFYFPGHVNM